jgi:hypothetical protein
MMASSAHVAWVSRSPSQAGETPTRNREGPARGYSDAKGLDDHLLVLL